MIHQIVDNILTFNIFQLAYEFSSIYKKLCRTLNLNRMKKLMAIALLGIFLGSCKDDDEDMTTPTPNASRTFKVVIENVSVPNTINSPRIQGTVPLSHGVYAIYASADPTFTPGQAADAGTERIAEDGFTTEKTNMLNNISDVKDHGEFVAPGGPDNGAALFAGESSMFFVTAKPGDKLQIQSMFVQSNDWFYSFTNGGLALFENGNAVSGDMTAKLLLYDAGTEEDTPPGTGDFQKPVQDPLAMNVGPADPVNMIQPAKDRHPSFTIPENTSVIKITITPQ
jgi:hypothetical protein